HAEMGIEYQPVESERSFDARPDRRGGHREQTVRLVAVEREGAVVEGKRAVAVMEATRKRQRLEAVSVGKRHAGPSGETAEIVDLGQHITVELESAGDRGSRCDLGPKRL